jgi:hypothetical protein
MRKNGDREKLSGGVMKRYKKKIADRYDPSGLVEAQFEPGSHRRVLKNLLGIKRKLRLLHSGTSYRNDAGRITSRGEYIRQALLDAATCLDDRIVDLPTGHETTP